MTPNAQTQETVPQQERKVLCEVYSRIVGYLRPVQSWNKGKRDEFARRVLYRPALVLKHTEGGSHG